MRMYPSFTSARTDLRQHLVNAGYDIKVPKWQGIDVSTKPEMVMREVLNWSFSSPLRGCEDLVEYQRDIKPNLPWADDHFDERVSRVPSNPGETWRTWPWGNAADKFRTEGGKFSHTYQERIWPKYAGRYLKQADLYPERGGLEAEFDNDYTPLKGIRYYYGDLDDVVDHLRADPLSRQAYLPIWFPEDGTCMGRKPCTLGYHFILRHDYFHHTYYIRSCDFVRHWSDDIYLAIRLHLWVLEALRERDPRWKDVKMGLFTMHIVSLHCFVNDLPKLRIAMEHEIPGALATKHVDPSYAGPKTPTAI